MACSPRSTQLRRLLLAVTTLVTAAAVGAMSPASASQPWKATFEHPGHYAIYFPSGVHRVKVTLYGAQGGPSRSGPRVDGGLGGEVTATFKASSGRPFWVWVGGMGVSPTQEHGSAGFVGCGDGGLNAGGGGGETSFRTSADRVSDRILVAGGGGGAGVVGEHGGALWAHGGGGGGLSGTNGSGGIKNGDQWGGRGGTQSAPGAAAPEETAGARAGGTGGNQSTGGRGGQSDYGQRGRGQGGGGGGCGYHGGGGGGSSFWISGGGGGGSSFVMPGVEGTTRGSVNRGDGRAVFLETS